MTISITAFNSKECSKLPAGCVEGYFALAYNPATPTLLGLESSWGESTIDLKDLIHAGETKTKLHLVPEANPVSLEYISEDQVYCIEGNDLSRIISMAYLKDVDQSVRPRTGDIYMYNGNLFYTFNLQNWKNSVDGSISDIYDQISGIPEQIRNLNNLLQQTIQQLHNLENRTTSLENNLNQEINNRKAADANLQNQINTINGNIANLQNSLNNLTSRVSAIEALLAKPAGIPSNARIAWGNINCYGDYSNTNSKTSGIYTHNPSTNVTDDLYFS